MATVKIKFVSRLQCRWLQQFSIRHTIAGFLAALLAAWMRIVIPGIMLAATGSLAPSLAAEESLSRFHSYYADVYAQARKAYWANTNDMESAARLARACFDFAEFATNDTQRASLAVEGIAICRQWVAVSPNSGAAHYYLGMNLGQLARTRTLGALKLVKEMEETFKKARELDPSVDYAGPDRCLGLLYRDAPVWPISVGNKSKTRFHLRRALELAGDFPENQLTWLESLLNWGEGKACLSQLPVTENVLQKARTNYVGEAWAASWEDWNRRWRVLTNSLSTNQKIKPNK